MSLPVDLPVVKYYSNSIYIATDNDDVCFLQTHKPHRRERTDASLSEGYPGGKTPELTGGLPGRVI